MIYEPEAVTRQTLAALRYLKEGTGDSLEACREPLEELLRVSQYRRDIDRWVSGQTRVQPHPADYPKLEEPEEVQA